MSEIWAAEENIPPEVLRNRIRFEEAFHVMTQFGYGAEWPSQFSTNEETYSILVSECEKATCVWWQHPENNCPDMLSWDDPEPCNTVEECTGGCLEANCNCVEWYHQVICIPNYKTKMKLLQRKYNFSIY